MYAVTITSQNVVDQIRGFDTVEDAEACFRNACYYYGFDVEDLEDLLGRGHAELRDGRAVCVNTVILDTEAT